MLNKLATEIGTFAYDYDPYETRDVGGTLEDWIRDTECGLQQEDERKGILEWLKDVAEYGNIFEERITAAKLYRKVKEMQLC